jgi:hypothetical protein
MAADSLGKMAVASPGAPAAFDVVEELEAVAAPGKVAPGLGCPGLVD